MEKRLCNQIILFIAQGAYSGRVPGAPGTAGTFTGVFLYLFLKDFAVGWYIGACIVTAGIAVWSAHEAEKVLGSKDHPSIVIDEIAGFLVAMAMAPPSWGFIALGFILFRVFDIVKPFPLKKIQNLHGGLGVVADDIGAGIYANVSLRIISEVLNV
jgi:phosphatidylglycerophosphatase A